MNKRVKTWLIIILILVAALEVGSILFSAYLKHLENGKLTEEKVKEMLKEMDSKPRKGKEGIARIDQSIMVDL